jgi:hypothetical protein
MRRHDKAVDDHSRNDRFPAHDGVRDVGPSCLACGTRIGRSEPTIQIHGALVHMRCAVYRRRVARQ